MELRTALDQAIDSTRAQIESRRHRLSINISDAPIVLDADPVRLSQMLANLLDNAAKYTPDGGEISITAELADNQVFISVRDTGFGIPQDQINNIFDLFTQLDTSQTSRGLGMGLSLVRNLAELHGGGIEVVSTGPGQGSVFTLRLPIFSKPSSCNEVNKPIEESVGSRGVYRVLLVEDDDDVAESMSALLAMDGHTVSTANNGTVAIETLHTFEPDVVLLDLGLPGIDGYQVARLMRSKTLREDLVIVALSGYGEEEHRRRSKEAGCDGHLVKPVQPDVLRDLVGKIRSSLQVNSELKARILLHHIAPRRGDEFSDFIGELGAFPGLSHRTDSIPFSRSADRMRQITETAASLVRPTDSENNDEYETCGGSV